jgi:hypothetical protein
MSTYKITTPDGKSFEIKARMASSEQTEEEFNKALEAFEEKVGLIRANLKVNDGWKIKKVE